MNSKIFVLISLLVTLPSFANDGGVSGGGGNAVGNDLFDLYENKGSQKFRPTEHPAFLEVFGEKMKHLERDLPEFAAALKKKSAEKNWYIEPKTILQRKECLNDSAIVVKKEIVACQTRSEIRISKKWFDSTSPRNQGALLMHEMLLALGDRPGYLTKEEHELAIRDANRLLLDDGLDAEEIQVFLRKRLGHTYISSKQLKLMNSIEAKLKKMENKYSGTTNTKKCQIFFYPPAKDGNRPYEVDWLRAHADWKRSVATQKNVDSYQSKADAVAMEIAEVESLSSEIKDACSTEDFANNWSHNRVAKFCGLVRDPYSATSGLMISMSQYAGTCAETVTWLKKAMTELQAVDSRPQEAHQPFEALPAH